MKANVYFADLRANSACTLSDKIRILLNRAGIDSVIQKNNLIAVKVHFGEKGNTAFIRPVFIRDILNTITTIGARPFLTDTNTLYRGERGEAVSHIAIALVHGFNFTALAAPVIIADGLRGTDETRVAIQAKHFHEALIGSAITSADALVCVSHFKGHELSGFGGALKNLGMGCASRAGKMKQHTDISPIIERKECTGCGRCMEQCPVQAIDSVRKKAVINAGVCIGCAKCITVCPQGAIKINWDENSHIFQEKMAEYALGAVQNKKNKLLFINFLTDISPQCDCYGHADQSIVPDIGILASADPVAIDQASADLVNSQQGTMHSALMKNHKPHQDKFRGLYPSVDWEVQLDYAAKLHIGTRRYKLIRVS
jgi:uncharacterized Fe-S center protein